MRSTEHHHSILDRKGIEVVQHDMVGFRKQSRITRNARVLVQDDLQQVWGKNGWRFKALLCLTDIGLLVVRSWR